jgi:hypothetical protein
MGSREPSRRGRPRPNGKCHDGAGHANRGVSHEPVRHWQSDREVIAGAQRRRSGQ